ncbi:hypothetical protein ALC56_03215 [Trachymyrmex septentrionalis]|uniref:Uncharacterized protein n=1 Tax=Trachymyrmex septentrionalis TaxID=34720 RepID=A0A195FP36_9HYME|nr:hypothetical protein ALC56_03215 [Trachymyrmex septentrionalis]
MPQFHLCARLAPRTFLPTPNPVLPESCLRHLYEITIGPKLFRQDNAGHLIVRFFVTWLMYVIACSPHSGCHNRHDISNADVASTSSSDKGSSIPPASLIVLFSCKRCMSGATHMHDSVAHNRVKAKL